MATAKRTGFGVHRDYIGSVEQINDMPAADDQVVDAAETKAIADAVDANAATLDTTGVLWVQDVDNYLVYLVVNGKPVHYYGSDTSTTGLEARKTISPDSTATDNPWSLLIKPDPASMLLTI